MKLNLECVKAVLEMVELNANTSKPFEVNKDNYKNYHHIKDFDYKDVEYTLNKLIECGYVQDMQYLQLGFNIIDLSYEGHSALKELRDPKNLQMILKNIATGIQTTSALASLAKLFS